MATTRTRGAIVIVALLATLVGRRIRTRTTLGGGTGFASGCGAEGVLAFLARQMATATARGIHATAAVLLLRLLSLALAGGVLACGSGLAGIDRTRALAAATSNGSLLSLGYLGLAATLTAAATLALALTGTSIGVRIATAALGHRRPRQTVGARQAIAHVDAVLAVELHKRQAHLGRLDALEHIARHAVGAAVAALLGGLLFAALRAGHVGQVDLKDFAVLQAQHQLLTRHVIFLDARLAKRRIDKRLLFGRAALKVLVRLELVAQAAHQATADAANFGRVERQVLLFCHADRNRLKLSAKARAAELLTALGIATHQAGLVTHADLAHVDANVQRRGQVLDELTEIDALLGGKVEHSLLAAEQVLDADRLHLEVELLDQAAEVDHGLIALDGQVVGKLQVDVARHAQHGLERLTDLVLRHLEGVGRDQADLGSALGGADGIIGLEDIQILWVEPQVARGVGKLNGYD